MMILFMRVVPTCNQTETARAVCIKYVGNSKKGCLINKIISNYSRYICWKGFCQDYGNCRQVRDFTIESFILNPLLSCSSLKSTLFKFWTLWVIRWNPEVKFYPHYDSLSPAKYIFYYQNLQHINDVPIWNDVKILNGSSTAMIQQEKVTLSEGKSLLLREARRYIID